MPRFVCNRCSVGWHGYPSPCWICGQIDEVVRAVPDEDDE
jgi:hypothetical protein